MRKQARGRRLLNAAFAVVLACGMTVPATAVAWAAGENEAAPPPY